MMNKSVSGITKRNTRSIQELKERRERSDDLSPKKKRQAPRQKPPGQRGSEKAATFGIWFVSIVAILFLFFLLSVMFAETTVTVYPKTADISIDNTYTADRSGELDGVGYSVVSAEEEIQLAASTTGSEYREEASSGEITIYNDYSNESLQLVPNTRFQTSDGLIFRIQETVMVPGKSESQPGSISATAYADAPGEEYNIRPTELSVPGFEGTPYEDLVYAESSVGMTGGIAAEVPIVASSTREALEEQAARQLEAELVAAVAAELPEGFVMYEDGQFFSAEITGSEEGDASGAGATLTVTGQLEAVTFDGKQLSTFLATNYSDDISENDDIRIQDLEDFTFTIENKEEFDIAADSSFTFTLTGDSQIVWRYDERALVRDLRGLEKDQLDDVLVNYPGIQEAEVVTRPFWKQTLPAEAEEITINAVIE